MTFIHGYLLGRSAARRRAGAAASHHAAETPTRSVPRVSVSAPAASHQPPQNTFAAFAVVAVAHGCDRGVVPGAGSAARRRRARRALFSNERPVAAVLSSTPAPAWNTAPPAVRAWKKPSSAPANCSTRWTPAVACPPRQRRRCRRRRSGMDVARVCADAHRGPAHPSGQAALNRQLDRAVRLLEKVGESEDPPPRFLYLFSDRTRAGWMPQPVHGRCRRASAPCLSMSVRKSRRIWPSRRWRSCRPLSRPVIAFGFRRPSAPPGPTSTRNCFANSTAKRNRIVRHG